MINLRKPVKFQYIEASGKCWHTAHSDLLLLPKVWELDAQ